MRKEAIKNKIHTTRYRQDIKHFLSQRNYNNNKINTELKKTENNGLLPSQTQRKVR